MYFKFCSTYDYKEEKNILEEKLKISKTIPDAQNLHCFIPQSNDNVLTKMFSNLGDRKEERVTILTKYKIPLDKIKGFVTIIFDKHRWLLTF